MTVKPQLGFLFPLVLTQSSEMRVLPLSLWAFHVALSRYRLGWRAVIATIVAGIVFHAFMIGSLPVFLAGGALQSAVRPPLVAGL